MKHAAEIRRGFVFVGLVTLTTLGGCHRHYATPADCLGILDRLVELELKEQGFRDPALAPRWQSELPGDSETTSDAARASMLVTTCRPAFAGPRTLKRSLTTA